MSGGYWTRVANRRTGRRKLMQGAAFATGGLATAALVGCGDDDDDDSGQTPSGPTPGTGETPGTDPSPGNGSGQQQGGRLQTAFQADWINFDPQTSTSGNTFGLANIFAQKLLHYSDDSLVSDQLVGVLAESWNNPDPQT